MTLMVIWMLSLTMTRTFQFFMFFLVILALESVCLGSVLKSFLAFMCSHFMHRTGFYSVIFFNYSGVSKNFETVRPDHPSTASVKVCIRKVAV